ncbi:hypothetical protein HOI18_00635 [Candidatus Uhrbacteria bacterium]|jgi:photosystem II stability/assembly factor-like uncharacterized protein|nr:hypothetical protein [Candidatus Uhrbacteria bacterium]
MRNLFIVLFAVMLTGAGCFGSSSTGGAGDGGIFKTSNAGEDWSQTVVVPTAQGLGTLAGSNVLNMEMDPQDNTYLYIGTRANGMLYSEDAGSSWRQPEYAALQSGTIYAVEVDPKDVCSLYVAKGSRLYHTSDCMRSFDNEVYVENRSGVNVIQVAIDWYDSDNIWVGLSNGDVLLSQDGGGSWQTSLQTGGEISEIIVSNGDSRQILASTFKGGVYRSDDRGDSWEKIKDQIKELKNADDVFSLVQSDDGGVVIAATQYGLLRSEDFGATWSEISLISSPGQLTIRAVAIDESRPSTIYYASNAAFYHSTDGGKTWNTERFPSNRIPRAMLVDPDDSSVLYVGVATSTD